MFDLLETHAKKNDVPLIVVPVDPVVVNVALKPLYTTEPSVVKLIYK